MATPTSSSPLLDSMPFRQIRLWTVFRGCVVVQFSFYSLQSAFLEKSRRQWWKLHEGIFSELYGCCPQQFGFCDQFSGRNSLFCINQGGLQISTVPACQHLNLMQPEPTWIKTWPVQTVTSITESPYWGHLCRFQEISSVLCFYTTYKFPQFQLSLSTLSLHFFFLKPDPSHSHPPRLQSKPKIYVISPC